MRKWAISIIILAVILVTIMSFTISSKSNYIKVSEYTNSHTKAICTAENFCQDYQIFCKNSEFIAKTPITSAVIQLPETWKDPRPLELRDNYCKFYGES